MRIRKRFPPSSLSDPQLNRSPLVQQRVLEANTCSQPSDFPNRTSQPPSDQRPMIESAEDVKGEDIQRLEEVEESNNTRKASILGADVGSGTLLQPTGSSDSQQEVGRWSEGDKVVPPKKRRDYGGGGGAMMEKEKKTKAKMKSNTKKKHVQPNKEQGSKANEEDDTENNSGGKKVKRGNVIMEGSRCSRVNGRGWRCCQQTLVGYSLCEHHLGKGRLITIASVQHRAMATTTTSAPKKYGYGELSLSTSSSLVKLGQGLVDHEDEDDDEDDEKKPLMVAKKRMKLGMVKARSISSLLSQRNTAVVVADNDKNSSV